MTAKPQPPNLITVGVIARELEQRANFGVVAVYPPACVVE